MTRAMERPVLGAGGLPHGKGTASAVPVKNYVRNRGFSRGAVTLEAEAVRDLGSCGHGWSRVLPRVALIMRRLPLPPLPPLSSSPASLISSCAALA